MSDWRTLDLSPGGRSLIEASAGTGKTWTIAALYLRLLLEQQRMPREIVVATFSEAAAQELRQRIRERLEAVARLLDDPEAHVPGDDGRDDWLMARRHPGDGLRLRLALAELDIAPIGTLHALCHRVLREQPFHTGSGFGGVSLVDGRRLHRELANDLWRRWTQDAALAVEATPWIAGGRDRLAAALELALRPGVRLPPEEDDGVAGLLADGNAEALRELAEDKHWYRPRCTRLPRGLRVLADWIDAGDGDAAFDDKRLEDLALPLSEQIVADRLEEAEDHPLFRYARRAAGVLGAAGQHRKLAALIAAVPTLRAAAQERMRERAQRSFDALVGEVDAALRGNPALAKALFEQWPVALVDEFQDTDSVQYAILDAIYSDAEGYARGRLALIGDPKQAIYGFRGGDVHTYLQAASRIGPEQRLPLAINQRSTTGYVAACNELFAQAGAGLSMRDADPGSAIAYREVTASGRHDHGAYSIDGVAVERPLVFHYHVDEDAVPAVAQRRRAALDGCAQLVVQLLDGRHRIGQDPLEPGDIAVLLPTNGDVAALRRRLVERGVPCVGAGRSSVFASDWARALQLQLQAAADPRNASALRAALATPLGGETFATLRDWRDADAESDPRWQAAQRRVEDWQRTWQRRGVLALVQAVIEAASMPLAALPLAERERALTDLRHLGELLQAREAELPGQAELLAWLAQQRDGEAASDEDAADEQSLRLESDARRVQLMTMHASKGLEFRLVVLPMAWDHTGRNEQLVAVHDGQPGRVLRNDAQAIAQAQCEQQDERLRLLYVALTRASHACHLFALDPARAKQKNHPAWKDPERSALDALLARAFGRIGQPLDGITLADAGEHIAWRQGWPAGDARLRSAQADTGRQLQLRPLPAPPLRLPRRHSFSTLLRHDRPGALEESAASDEAVAMPADAPAPTVQPPHPQLQALQAWRGTAFGNALHDVLEQRRIGQPLAEQADLVISALRRRGVLDADAELAAGIATRLDGVLDAQLLPGLRLGALPGTALRAEMTFDYLLDSVSVQQLRALLAAHGWTPPPLSASILHGLMTGKIDLVFRHDGRFHVLDWKGNWLGETLQDYRGPALERAMDAHHYRLQALLYTVAVERYLRGRMGAGYRREAHLGQTIYLFVRAVGLDGDAGVWAHRFDDRLLDAVDALLAGTEVAA